MTTVSEFRVQRVELVGQERRMVTIPPRRGQVKKMMFEAIAQVIAQAFVSVCDDSCLGAVQVMPDSPHLHRLHFRERERERGREMTTVGEFRVQRVENVGQERRMVTIPPRRGQVKKMMFEAIAQVIAQAFVSVCDDSCLGAVQVMPDSPPPPPLPPSSSFTNYSTTTC